MDGDSLILLNVETKSVHSIMLQLSAHSISWQLGINYHRFNMQILFSHSIIKHVSLLNRAIQIIYLSWDAYTNIPPFFFLLYSFYILVVLYYASKHKIILVYNFLILNFQIYDFDQFMILIPWILIITFNPFNFINWWFWSFW